MNEELRNVPEDYVLVDCDNPACDYTVWVPDLEVDGTPVVRVCSAACAMAVVKARGMPPQPRLA